MVRDAQMAGCKVAGSAKMFVENYVGGQTVWRACPGERKRGSPYIHAALQVYVQWL